MSDIYMARLKLEGLRGYLAGDPLRAAYPSNKQEAREAVEEIDKLLFSADMDRDADQTFIKKATRRMA